MKPRPDNLRRVTYIWLCWVLAMLALPVAGALWGDTYIGAGCVLLSMAIASGSFMFVAYRTLAREERYDEARPS